MRIDKIKISKPFAYLWLKRVTDVDLTKHCAKCLIGEYDNRLRNKIGIQSDMELSDGIWYLCGVAKPYRWENNFHLAFASMPGTDISVENNGIAVTIEDAIVLPISEDYIDDSLEQSSKKAFRTCRNWQFANYLRCFGI